MIKDIEILVTIQLIYETETHIPYHYVCVSHIRSPHSLQLFVASVVKATNSTITTLGRLTLRRENGLSYNVLGLYRHPVKVTPLSSLMVLCMSLVGARAKPLSMICLAFNCRVSDLACLTITLFTCEMQRSDGLNFTTWGQVHIEGRIIPWLLTGHVSLCLEDLHQVDG